MLSSWNWIVAVICMGIVFFTGYFLIVWIGWKTDKLNFTSWIFTPIVFAIGAGVSIGMYFALAYTFAGILVIGIVLGFALGTIVGHAQYRFKRRYDRGVVGELM